MDKQLNCYSCAYRGEVMGSAHSCCKHPMIEQPLLKSMLILKLISGSLSTNPTGLVASTTKEDDKIEVSFQDWSETGIRNGYVLFPIDFDPIWLNHCLLHKEK